MSSISPSSLDLSVVIVNYKSVDFLRSCIRSIKETAEGISYEIIAVDNDSQDGSDKEIRFGFPDIKLIANRNNLGFSSANNQGIKISKGRYILLLNNDATVTPGALKCLIDSMERHPGVGLMGGKLTNTDGTVQQSFGRLIPYINEFVQSKLFWNFYEIQKNRTIGMLMEKLHCQPRYVDWVKGACMMLRREAIFDVDFLDDRFFMYFEEADLCIRLKIIGWKVYFEPRAEIVHHGGISVSKNRVRVFLERRRSQLYFYKKHYGDFGLWWIKNYLLLKLNKNKWLSQFKRRKKLTLSAEDKEQDRLLAETFKLVREFE
jgi:GT2 family glycosyltransferase